MLSIPELVDRLAKSEAELKMTPGDVQKLILAGAVDDELWTGLCGRVNLTRAKADELPIEGDIGWGEDPKDGTGK